MKDTYIVAFKAGSSGRLIANIIWGLLDNTNYECVLTDFNSTHNFTPYATSFDLSLMPDSMRMFSDPKIYSYFTFTSNPGIITVHPYPDFNAIRERFPNTKIIIISYNDNDIDEISGNSLLKNGFENLLSNNIRHNNETKFISLIYKKMFHEEYIGQSLDESSMREIFSRYYKIVFFEFYNSQFINPIVPVDFVNKTLVLEYREICTDMQGVLNKISKFTNADIQNGVVQLYEDYLIGRHQLIDTHMPWLDK